MPTVPRQTKCGYLGCTNERSPLNSYCMEHGGKTYNQSKKRKQSNAKYNTALWHKLRLIQLSKQPLCQACMVRGRVTQATVVDHLFPWNQLGEVAFVANVMQSLCPECHSVKTGLEQQGVFRHYTNPTKDYAIQDWQAVCLDTPKSLI